MSLPLTDDNGVVQTIANGTPVSWNAGLGYDANGLLCVTSTISATDTWQNGWRRDIQGRLVVSQSTPEGQPFVYSAGWPTDKNTGAIITQQNIPAPTDPRIAGVAVGPLGGVYMTEGGYIWTPLVLWPDGVDSPGMWIDPSLLTASFNDYTGTTPVSTPGTVADTSNPVGLALDIRAGAPDVLGPELVVNGDFSDGSTGWSWSNIVDGKAVYDGANSDLFQDIGPLKIGAFYQVSWYQSGAYIYVRLGGSGNLGSQSGAGQKTMILSSPGTAGLVLVQGGMTPNVDYIDNVSVKEVPGNHMLQSTSAARPLESARVNLLQYTEDFTNGYWFNETATVTPNYGTAPDGTQTSTRLQFAGANLAILKANILSSNTPSTASCWIKGPVGETLQFEASLDTGNLVTLTGAWQRATCPHAAGQSFIIGTYSGATARDIEVWHPQFELGLDATDYQAVLSNGSTYATAFPIFQKYDGVDDGMATATFAAGTLSNAMDCLIPVRRDSGANAILGLWDGQFHNWFGAAESGSASVCYGVAGTPTVWVDGVQLSGGTAVTRSTLHTALTVGDYHILEFRDLNLSTWLKVSFANYPDFLFNGGRGDIMLYPSTASTTDKDAARQYLADKYGVTLPAWVGRYNYVTPPTSSIPVAGEIVHGDNLLNKLNFSKTDLDGQTYMGPPLTTGHEVKIGDQVYTLVAPPVDFSSYITLTIEPATQLADGTYPVLVY